MPRHYAIVGGIVAKYGPAIASRLMKAEYGAYRGVGWKPHAARTLVVVTNIGATAKYMSDQFIDTDSASPINGPKANPQNKTRSRSKFYSGSRYKFKSSNYHCRRCASSRKHNTSRNW